MHLTWRAVAAREGGPGISTSITTDEAAMLARLAAGQRVLEVGSAYGYSACVMALAGALRITAVDPHSQLRSLEPMRSNLAQYGVSDRVTIMPELSWSALPAIKDTGARFGLIFIDGDHGYEAVRHDVSWSRELLEPGGVLACHDYEERCCCAGVAQALDELLPQGREMTDTLAVYRGVAA
jgi:predicted O-methyltransferase YrrM